MRNIDVLCWLDGAMASDFLSKTIYKAPARVRESKEETLLILSDCLMQEARTKVALSLPSGTG